MTEHKPRPSVSRLRPVKAVCFAAALTCSVVGQIKAESLPPTITPLPLSVLTPSLPDVPLAAPPLAASDSSAAPPRASDRYLTEADKVSRIEAKATNDADGAARDAEELKIVIEFERSNRLAQAAQSDARADSWRELAGGSDEDAKRNLQRANEASLASRGPGLSIAERAEYQSHMTFWSRQATDDQTRAAERREEINTHVVEGERHKDAAAYLAGLIARLDKLIDRARQTKEERNMAENAAGEPDPFPEEESETTADYEIRFQQILGIWRPDEAPDASLIIVSENPEGDAPYKLQLFTRDRIWSGRFDPYSQTSEERLRKPRMTFEYTPKAKEMNPGIPQWAREKIEGLLKWKIDAYEIGTAADARLGFRFFRGRVRWNDGDKTAVLDGEGPPKNFDAGRDTVLESRTSAPTMLFVSLANNAHDPSLKSIDAVVQGTPLHVNVITSSISAREIGSSLSIDISAEGGSPSKLTLTRQHVTQDNRVVYGHEGVVTIGGDGPERDFPPYSASPRRIIGWLSTALDTGEMEPGPRLSSVPKNGGAVTFSYGDAYQTFPVYVTWVQRALVQHEKEIDSIAATYGGILVSNASAKTKTEVTLRLHMLANLQTLFRSDALTDLHRLEIAEAYLGRPKGRQLLDYGLERFNEVDAARSQEIMITSLDRERWLSVCGTQTGAFTVQLVADRSNRDLSRQSKTHVFVDLLESANLGVNTLLDYVSDMARYRRHFEASSQVPDRDLRVCVDFQSPTVVTLAHCSLHLNWSSMCDSWLQERSRRIGCAFTSHSRDRPQTEAEKSAP